MKIKTLIVALLVVGMLLPMAAMADTAQEPVTIEFWHGMSGGVQDALVALTDQFNAENGKGITVNLVNQGAYADLSKKLMGAIASNSMPDLSQVYNGWIAESLDIVVPLDDFIAKDFDNYEDILESYRREGAEFGKTYTIAFNKSSQVYFYNKTKYQELGLSVPTTWEELYNVSKALYEATGNPAVGYDDLVALFQQYVLQNGGEFIEDGQVKFSSPEGMEALGFYLDLCEKGYARIAGEDKYMSTPFNGGDVYAYVGSSAGAAYITPNGFEYGAAPLPKGVKGAVPQAGTNLAMFSQDENKQAAAWEYVKFLTGTEATTQWAIATGYLPIRTSAFESEAYQQYMAASEVAQACYAQVADQYFESAYPGSNEVRNLINAEVEAAILEGKSAEDAVNTLAEKVTEILNRQ